MGQPLATWLLAVSSSQRERHEMPKLRKGARREILSRLDGTFFKSQAFEVTMNQSEEEILRIVFREKPEFFISVKNEKGSWWTTEAPGTFLEDEEIVRLPDLGNCLQRIRPWTDRILEELAQVEDSKDRFARLRHRIESYADSLPDPETPFKPEEVREFNTKLDNLVHNFEEMKERNEIQQSQLNELKAEVAKLKEQNGKIAKRTFVKAAGYGLLAILQRGGIKLVERLGDEGAQQLLTHFLDNNN